MQLSFDNLYAKKDKNYQNLTNKSGSKQIFRILQEKVIIQDSGSKFKSPVLDLNGGIWVFRKIQKISTASDLHFSSYVKKLQGGGAN